MTTENIRSRARKDGGLVIPELDAQSDDVESHRRETLNALVGEQVLHALGDPGDLLTVQVRPLWEGNYRVNVFVGANAACARIAHSYFVAADGDGNVVKASPAISRCYWEGGETARGEGTSPSATPR
jgi:hypothetical protein